jgi:hypothetical protein
MAHYTGAFFARDRKQKRGGFHLPNRLQEQFRKVITLKDFTVLQKAIFYTSAAHAPKRALALRFVNITFFADCKILNCNNFGIKYFTIRARMSATKNQWLGLPIAKDA